MQIVKTVLLIAALLYGSAVLAGYLLQERFIFHPRVVAPDYVYDWGEEVLVETSDGTLLSTVWVRKPDSRGVTIYFHGNVGDNNRGRYQARALLREPRDVVVVDYRGFGKSTGEMSSDEQLLSDAQAVYDRVAEDYGESDIRLVGYSLGSGMAAYLAAENAPAHLTLVSPYTSLVDMKNRWFGWLPDALLKYRLDTRSRIADIACPIDIYHGTGDRLIPYEMAEELAGLNPRVALHPLEGLGHRATILAVGRSGSY